MFENITTEDQLTEICKDLDKFNAAELVELYKLSKKLATINEMAYSKSQFIEIVGDYVDQIHYNIVNIIILGNTISAECVYHWRKELMTYINKLFGCSVSKAVKKDKLVYEFIVEPYVDHITLQYDTDYMVKSAILDEIRKGEKDVSNKIKVKFMRTEILPNISKYIEQYNSDFSIIFKSLIDAFSKNNLSIFVKALDKIIND